MAYFLKKSKLKKGLYLQIYFSYRDPETGKPRNRSHRSLGYAEALQMQGISDPIDYGQQEVDRLNAEFQNEKTVNHTRQISEISPLKNLGYFPLQSILASFSLEKEVTIAVSDGPDETQSLYDSLETLILQTSVMEDAGLPSVLTKPAVQLYGRDLLEQEQILSVLQHLGKHAPEMQQVFQKALQRKYPLYQPGMIWFHTDQLQTSKDGLVHPETWSSCVPGCSNAKDPDPAVLRGAAMILDLKNLLTDCFKMFVLKDQFSHEQIESFLSGFAILPVSERNFINLSSRSELVEWMAKTWNLPLCQYNLTKKDLNRILSYRSM